jgi:hypothetical protein
MAGADLPTISSDSANSLNISEKKEDPAELRRHARQDVCLELRRRSRILQMSKLRPTGKITPSQI